MFSSRCFLAFDPRCFLWCFPLKDVLPQDCLRIPKVSYRTFLPNSCFRDRLFACSRLLRELSTSVFVRSADFLTLLPEWVGDWRSSASDSSLSECWLSSLIWNKRHSVARKLFLSLTRVDFAVSSRPYMFFRPCYFDVYGPRKETQVFSLWFSN